VHTVGDSLLRTKLVDIPRRQAHNREVRFREERDIWSDLRSTRYSPPDEAGNDDERRATYVSALQQAEELFRAARSVGPASRPLLLFYGMSQAGRAIAAASVRVQSSDWTLSGHGIKARNLTAQLPDITVQTESPSSRSSFCRLSVILGVHSRSAERLIHDPDLHISTNFKMAECPIWGNSSIE